jgi:tRNA 5-methylaminomethyl-2-thiouridine biosynthesis bifunctional protein
MQQMINQENIPPELLRYVTHQEASNLANCILNRDAWYFPEAAWCIPKLVCQTLLKRYKQKISFLGNNQIISIKHEKGVWRAINHRQKLIAQADIAIVTSAYASNQFEQTKGYPLHAKRGQITLIPHTKNTPSPQTIICADAYITPAVDNHYVLGASFITNDTHTDVRMHEHEQNLAKLAQITPSFKNIHAQDVLGRAAIRAVSPDRLPIVGPVADQAIFSEDYKMAAIGSTHQHYPAPTYLPGLYIATGFGSRGMTWIPLCAEALACTITGEPGPLDHKIADAIHPNRLLMKQLISDAKKHRKQ